MLYRISLHRDNEVVFLNTETMKLCCISLHGNNEVVVLYTETMKLYFSTQRH